MNDFNEDITPFRYHLHHTQAQTKIDIQILVFMKLGQIKITNINNVTLASQFYKRRMFTSAINSFWWKQLLA